jgi:hypothetical protein
MEQKLLSYELRGLYPGLFISYLHHIRTGKLHFKLMFGAILMPSCSNVFPALAPLQEMQD